MIQAVLFNLDDTLYPEQEYRSSGLRHLSQLLSESDGLLDLLVEFDHSSANPVKEMAKVLLAEYRGHRPEITLYPETPAVLDELGRGYRLGLVTNDTAGSQQRKIDALAIAPWFHHVTIAQPPHLKPTRRPYLDTLEALGVQASEAVFVSSDRTGDLFGASRIGMHSVQVARESAGGEASGAEAYQPTGMVPSLAELPAAIETLTPANSPA